MFRIGAAEGMKDQIHTFCTFLPATSSGLLLNQAPMFHHEQSSATQASRLLSAYAYRLGKVTRYELPKELSE
jgi:hypothetical protein